MPPGRSGARFDLVDARNEPPTDPQAAELDLAETLNGLNGPAGSAVDNTAAGTTSTLTVGNTNANGIAVDAAGNIYVADIENSRIKMLAPVATPVR